MAKTTTTTKRIHYVDGPPSIEAGIAGRFEAGVSRDIDAETAQMLLSRGDNIFREGPGPLDNPEP